jgi:hypothetical protein
MWLGLLQVVALLSALQTAHKGIVTANVPPAIANTYSHALEQQAKSLAGGTVVVQRNKQEAVTAINVRLRSKLFTPPRTLHTFFSKSATKLPKSILTASLATASSETVSSAACGRAPGTNMPACGPHLIAKGQASLLGTGVNARVSGSRLTGPVLISDVVDLCDSMDASQGLPAIAAAACGASASQPAHRDPAHWPSHVDHMESPMPDREEVEVHPSGDGTYVGGAAVGNAVCQQQTGWQETTQANRASNDGAAHVDTEVDGKLPRSTDENESDPHSTTSDALEIGMELQTHNSDVLSSQDLNGKRLAASRVNGAEDSRPPKMRCLHTDVSCDGAAGNEGKAFTRDDILNMGFKRTDVDVALKITCNDGARAIEYLLTR